MHTVLERPDPLLRYVTENLINASAAVVVLAERAREIIATHYRRANLDKVVFIPHGTPRVRREPTERFKRQLGLDGFTVLSTFGLLGPDKGIEYAIRALPAIVARHPDVAYLVLGQTHPSQRKRVGESYREMLEGLVNELGMGEHVHFYNHYLNMEELLRFLQATDVYVMPYLNPAQIVSGTLAYAVACGKPVVATPFVYAREMLDEGRGMVVNARDPDALATAANTLLDNPVLRAQMEMRAYNHGLRMHWPAVGVAYCRLFRRVADEHHAAAHSRDAAAHLRRVARTRRAAALAAPARLGSFGMGLPAPATQAAGAGGLVAQVDPGLNAGPGRAARSRRGARGASTTAGDTILPIPLP
jgi:glycosyltransferase involved in cell wall biosynthesis